MAMCICLHDSAFTCTHKSELLVLQNRDLLHIASHTSKPLNHTYMYMYMYCSESVVAKKLGFWLKIKLKLI